MIEGVSVFEGGVEEEVGVPRGKFDVRIEEEDGVVRGDAIEGGYKFGGAGDGVEGGVDGALDCYAGASGEVVGVQEVTSEGVNGDGGVEDDGDAGWTVGFGGVRGGGDGAEETLQVSGMVIGVDDDFESRNVPGCRG